MRTMYDREYALVYVCVHIIIIITPCKEGRPRLEVCSVYVRIYRHMEISGGGVRTVPQGGQGLFPVNRCGTLHYFPIYTNAAEATYTRTRTLYYIISYYMYYI